MKFGGTSVGAILAWAATSADTWVAGYRGGRRAIDNPFAGMVMVAVVPAGQLVCTSDLHHDSFPRL